ncbi:hypothetical protein VTO42DRAFT_4363 [Malbranchea cinnamomea]
MSGQPRERGLLDVAVIGAGLGGISVAVNLRQRYPHATFAVFEQNHLVGGTWAKNTYPGLRCDIPSQLYSYSFALNPNWSSTYALQPEILAYINDVVDRHRLKESIFLQQECLSARWRDDDSTWGVRLLDHVTGEEYTVHCHVLITSVGFLHIPKGTEDIANYQAFQGKTFHSSAWDHEAEFEGKNVVVIGNGCSANQFIPWLLEHGNIKSLTQVIRSAHWIAPKVDKLVGEKKKRVLNLFPFVARAHRWWLAAKLDLAFSAFRKTKVGGILRKLLETKIRSYMKRAAPPKYHSLLIPTYPFGAKRPVLDHGYLNALHDPRVTLIRSEKLQAVDSHMLATESGQQIPADILILANGFQTQDLLTPMKIQGRNGAVLPDLWHEDGKWPAAYMGTMVASFPNFFILTGPNTIPSGHSALIGIECTVDYILRLLRPLLLPRSNRGCTADRHVGSIEVRSEAQERFNRRIQRKLDKLVCSSNGAVRNWYVDERTGRNTLIWPGTQLEFWVTRCVLPVRWSDFAIDI